MQGGGDLGDDEWKQVPVRMADDPPPGLTSPPQLSLYNRYEALGQERQVSEEIEKSSSRGLSRMRQSTPCLKTVSVKNKRRVMVIGDSLLRGTEYSLVC